MSAIFAVARVTLRELVSQKVTWVFAAGAIALLALCFLLGNLSFTEQLRIYVHLGFFSISLVALALALTIAGSAIPREIERQTAQLSLARPLSRGSWLCGKWAGLAVLLLFFCMLACFLHAAVILFLFGAEAIIGNRYVFAAAAIFFEALAVLSCTFALSVRVRPTLAVLGGGLLWAAANWLPDLEFFARKSGTAYFQFAAEILKWVLPPFDKMQIRTASFVTGEGASPDSLPLFLLFCAGWVVVYLGCAVAAFRRRDLV